MMPFTRGMIRVRSLLFSGPQKLACLALGTAVCCLLLSGCGDSGPLRYHVSGTVTHEGVPVPKGSILFQPEGAQGDRQYGSATINDGKFDTAAEGGEGIMGGPHLVSIEAFDGSTENPDLMPHGRSLGTGYREPFELPQKDTTLNIELTERTR